MSGGARLTCVHTQRTARTWTAAALLFRGELFADDDVVEVGRCARTATLLDDSALGCVDGTSPTAPSS